MVFSSLFFLCVFLPVSLLLYFIIKNKTYRNLLLMITSLIFYAWGEPVWVTILIFNAFFDYFAALVAGKNRGNWKSKAAVAAAVIVNLSFLVLFKYSDFLVENVNALLGTSMPSLGFSLPIGISFYTFQIISYVLDVYRGDVEAQEDPFKLLLYVSLFHQLIAGPIVRYRDVAAEIEHRVVTWDNFNKGVGRFITGLGKKVIIANTAGEIAGLFLDTNYSQLPVLGAWFGILLYALQIYFDFSGYSDMAIGLGKMFGFNYKENFDYPYISRSATEFWRRWHISLGTFFRDYVYIPLGGNRRHHFRNLLVVWFLTGMWHGASWNFILWGLYYFGLIVLEKAVLQRWLAKFPEIVSRLYLWVAVLIGWVFFYHTNLGQAFRFIGVMFGIRAGGWSNVELSIHFSSNAVFVIVAILGCTPIARFLYKLARKLLSGSQAGIYALDEYIKPACVIGILIISIIFMVGQSYNPFLYFKF